VWAVDFKRRAVRELEGPKGLGARQAAAQLQQRPAPEEGNVFKRAWFKHYTTPPARFDQIVLSVDCSFKDEASSSWVVLQAWGKLGGEFYLLDQVRRRMSFVETCAEFAAFARKWRSARAKLIEDKANGTAVIDTFKKKVAGIIPINPKGSKYARAVSVSSLVEAGNVFLPDPERVAWVDEYVEEMVGFPAAPADDQVDATSQALNWMYMRSFSYANAAKNAPFLFGPS
jgi:predicted phage terminase large subunit-like protein